MIPQYPPKALLAGVRRVRVNLEVPTNADLLPLTGWRLQVEDILRKQGLTIAEQDGSTVDALVKVWLSVIQVCTVSQGRDRYDIYSFVIQLTVYSNYTRYAGDLVIGYNAVAHGSTTSDTLVRSLEQALADQATRVGEVLKK